MTVNTLAILTNLPFRFQYHLPLPGPRLSQSTDLFWILISSSQVLKAAGTSSGEWLAWL
jgi:hypothetical protein